MDTSLMAMDASSDTTTAAGHFEGMECSASAPGDNHALYFAAARGRCNEVWHPLRSSDTGHNSAAAVSEQTTHGPVTRGQGGRPMVRYAVLHSGIPAVNSFNIREQDPTDNGAVQAGGLADHSGIKKKVGRPIAYKGDMNSPHLTEIERRRIKRRVTNRESARRVRHKRQENMSELKVRMSTVEETNQAMLERLEQAQLEKETLTKQLCRLQQECITATSHNQRLLEDLERKSVIADCVVPALPAYSAAYVAKHCPMVAAACASTNAVTSGLPQKLQTLSTDAGHFRPGALVTSALAKYSRSVASSVPNSSAIRNAFPAHPGCNAFWYAPHLQRLPQLSSECITVPEICLSPTSCPINIVSPFNQVAAQQGHFSSSMPHNQGHISVKSEMWRQSGCLLELAMSDKDPLDLLFLDSTQDALSSGMCVF